MISPLDRLLATVKRTAEPVDNESAVNAWRREYRQDVPKLVAVIEVMREALEAMKECDPNYGARQVAGNALAKANEAAGDMWYCRECGKGVTMADMVADEHANVWCQEHKK
jgi:hypothetical protein